MCSESYSHSMYSSECMCNKSYSSRMCILGWRRHSSRRRRRRLAHVNPHVTQQSQSCIARYDVILKPTHPHTHTHTHSLFPDDPLNPNPLKPQQQGGSTSGPEVCAANNACDADSAHERCHSTRGEMTLETNAAQMPHEYNWTSADMK